MNEIIIDLQMILEPAELAEIDYYIVSDSLSTGLQLIWSPKLKFHATLLEKIGRELAEAEKGLNQELNLNKTYIFMGQLRNTTSRHK